MRKEFDDFIYYLTELLNHTFSRKGGWFLSDNKFNRLGATIEHENGVRFELYDEEVNNSSDVTLIVEYPNGKSKWLGAFWQKDLTDIADKMYEYAVVRNRNESRRKLEMGINKAGMVEPISNKFDQRKHLIHDLRQLQYEINPDNTIENYSSLLYHIANDFYATYVVGKDKLGLNSKEELRRYIKEVYGDIIDGSEVIDNKIYFDVYVEIYNKMDNNMNVALENSKGFSDSEVVSAHIEPVDDSNIKVCVRVYVDRT